MIKFEKVSLKEFSSAVKNLIPVLSDDEVKRIWDNIKIPERGTSGSAGYDFFFPYNGTLSPGINTTIPTGIRFITDEDNVVLLLCPRSGLGFKHGVRLRNTTGVIDSDYWMSDNEGHIMAKMQTEDEVTIVAGKAFMQGIITKYLTVTNEDDSNMMVRNGGFGSTNK